MNDDVFLFRSKAVQSLKVFHFFLLFFTGRSEVKPTLTERGLWSCRVFAALLKDTSAWWIGALLTSSFSKSNHQSLILFLVLENAFYWNCRWSHFLCHHISPWAVSRHLANQITCKWMLLEPSPLFTLASIRLLQLLSLMLNTLGWADVVLKSPPEIREELSSWRSAKPHLPYQQGVCLWLCVQCGGCLGHSVNHSNTVSMSQSIISSFWEAVDLSENWSWSAKMYAKCSRNDFFKTTSQ